MSTTSPDASRPSRTAEYFGMAATIISLAGLAYVIVKDRLDAQQLETSRIDDRAVVRALESSPGRTLSKVEILGSSSLDANRVTDALNRLVTNGLVAVRSDGTYKLATTEFLEVSAQLEKGNLALNEQIQKIQSEVKQLEEQRNQLMADGNDTQEMIVDLNREQNELRASTNRIAETMSELMSRNNELMQLNSEQLRQAIRNEPKFATAINLIRNDVISVEPSERTVINSVFERGIDADQVPMIYGIIHKYFPEDFETPSEKPWSNMNTPEMLMLDALSGAEIVTR